MSSILLLGIATIITFISSVMLIVGVAKARKGSILRVIMLLLMIACLVAYMILLMLLKANFWKVIL